jgi:hypothetical protein
LQAFEVIPGDDGARWLQKKRRRTNAAQREWGVRYNIYVAALPRRKVKRKRCITRRKPGSRRQRVEHNSADAQYILGMLDCWKLGCARSTPAMLETARWFRMAAHLAHQRLKEAQWELGEWFRRGVFCDVHMGFARKYIRRPSKQGHAAALSRMAELRRCVCRGAYGAPRKCKMSLVRGSVLRRRVLGAALARGRRLRPRRLRCAAQDGLPSHPRC